MRIYTYQRGKARIRGPYWLVFLLRYAGARISKAINIQYDDIDFRNAEIKLTILKRHNKSRKKNSTCIVPVPANITSEIATYIAEFPGIRGKVFKIYQSNFRRKFYDLAEKQACQRI